MAATQVSSIGDRILLTELKLLNHDLKSGRTENMLRVLKSQQVTLSEVCSR